MNRTLIPDPSIHAFGEKDVAVAFEMAYQIRVAVEKIRFVIKSGGRPAQNLEMSDEWNLQLLEALQRLESAERSFQHKTRSGSL